MVPGWENGVGEGLVLFHAGWIQQDPWTLGSVEPEPNNFRGVVDW